MKLRNVLAFLFLLAVLLCLSACTECEHVFQEKTKVEASCDTQGMIVFSCSKCEEENTQTVAMVPHNYDEGKVTTEASCTEEGIKTFTCTVCSDAYTEPVALVPHNYDEGKVTTEASCTEEGIKTFTCIACSDAYTEPVAMLPHDYKNGKCTQCSGIIPVYHSERFLDDFQGVSFTYTGIEYVGDYFQIRLRVENTTDEYITVQLRNEKVNGHSGWITMSEFIPPNTTKAATISVDAKSQYGMNLEMYGEDIIDYIEFNFFIWYQDRTRNQHHTSRNHIVLYPYA